MLALTARPPDLLVSADGHHVAVLLAAYDDEGPRLALLREHAGDFLRDVWGGVTAATADAAIADLPAGDCSADACVARVGAGPHSLRLLATLSKDRIGQPAFGPACAAADIVVSDRRLPDWCRPRWLKLDRTALGHDRGGRDLARPPPRRDGRRADRRPSVAAAAAGLAAARPAAVAARHPAAPTTSEPAY